ncbi:hypothetical protein HUB98_05105 [Paenibacillus barcinonensis]|uniref:Uncharacterized protein n=1 Tax=Paenibacillus barcinonensis TaxID=198119 RepID=A0A2V4W7T5_PAEBA|nr:hypothetical protein [Paenibacillus barcinonensis]PYE51363.1 hypothetical protein DFQ00_102156 [Paenibacillus barcinonensis]QKS55760.1 hypothetical protein HUB98_05105 [Paenibacillus barcinonensis]
MNRRFAARRFERLYTLCSKRMERRVLRLILFLIILAFLYQLLLLVPGLKKIMTTIDRLEGTPIHLQSTNRDGVG